MLLIRTAEIERLRAELERYQTQFNPLQNQAIHMGLTEETIAYLHPELQHQPEPPQESLETQVLKFLATCEFSKTYMEISEGIHGNAILKLNNINDLVKAGYLKRNSRGWQITAAGRDYLASLDKPTPTKEYYPDDYPLAEGKTKAKLNIE